MPIPFYLLTAFGKDRPGIVAHVTRLIYQLNGNIEDASMTRLGGEFAMMLVVAFPNSHAGDRLVKALPLVQRQTSLTINAKPITRSLAHAKRQSQATHLISVYGTDRPGIVYKAAQTLADRHINITD